VRSYAVGRYADEKYAARRDAVESNAVGRGKDGVAGQKLSRNAIPNRFVTARTLQRAAAAMLPFLPFYRTIAHNRRYASLWSKPAVTPDPAAMEMLLHLVGYGPVVRRSVQHMQVP